jgi:hypothetical protein
MSNLRKHIFGLIASVVLTASSCFNVPDPEYKTRLTKIPLFLKDHFPNQLQNDRASTLITNTDTTSHCIYYFLLQYGDDSIIELDTSNIAQQVLATYHAADTNIISIKRETVTYWNPEKKKYYTDGIHGNKHYYPVPYFETENHSFYKGDVKDIYSSETLSGLSKDFMIYVFDFKTGNYWEGLKPLDYLPEGWENGYSKGIAINKRKKILIHWFVVW